MGDLFSIKHVAQLHEIQAARLKRGLPGIGHEVEELIQRLTSGGVGVKTDDPRTAQAKVLWDKGWGMELGIESFGAYLETVPEVPERLLVAHDGRFPDLILVDGRVTLTAACRLAGLQFDGDNETFEDFYPKKARDGLYWMRCQDGRKNRKRSVHACRESFAPDELGLTVIEGVAYRAQKPMVIYGHFVDLPGSFLRDTRGMVASIGYWNTEPVLRWEGVFYADPCYGSASRLA